jgi:hypothetical protein
MLDFTAPGHEGERPPRLLERRAAADRLTHHSGRAARGHRTKKTLEIDPFQAENVRLIFRLAWEGDGTSGPMVGNPTSKFELKGLSRRRSYSSSVHNKVAACERPEGQPN